MTGQPIVALMVDLMDRSRLGAADVRFTKDATQFAQALAADDATAPVLAIADLTLPGAAQACAAARSTTRVVGFAPHEQVSELAGPASHTHLEAWARSKFFRRLGELLTWAANQDRPPSDRREQST